VREFVLLHGGLHGAWCWEALVPKLEHLGVRVFTFDLPGHGEDRTPRETVTFESYVAKVNRFIERENLDGFSLVGHSLAGIVLPEVMAANRERVREAVYIAAFILDAGERTIDLVDEERRPDYYRLAEESGDGTLSVPWERARERFFNDLDEDAARAAYARLTPQPLAPYLTPARHGAREFAAISRYVVCLRDVNFPPQVAREWAAKVGGGVQEIDSGHDPMLSRPAELARLLAGLAGG